MGKLIAVWGTPNSGKTTFSVKLSEAINTRIKSEAGHSVITVFSDDISPVIPALLPFAEEKHLYSLGTVLSKSEMTKNSVMSNAITLKGKNNLAYFGYLGGENLTSYPSPTEDKVNELYSILKNSAEYVVVDCMTMERNILTHVALKSADIRIHLSTPDYKCLSYQSSQAPIFMRQGIWERSDLFIMNVVSEEGQYSTGDLKSTLGPIEMTVPYCNAVRTQWQEGSLTEETKDKKYAKAMMNARKEVTR